jgi:hypothetical protein
LKSRQSFGFRFFLKKSTIFIYLSGAEINFAAGKKTVDEKSLKVLEAPAIHGANPTPELE